MAKKEEDNFQYIVRIAATDIDGSKPVRYALTQIKGVGNAMAKLVAQQAGVDPFIKIGKLPEKDIQKLNEVVAAIPEWSPPWMRNRQKDRATGEDRHLIGPQIETTLRDDINLMKKIRCYRGIRHERNLPVRGQRTRSNKRSGLTVGVSRRRASK
ncbi:MAG TPA: 30S ribosomal protein S13 [Thermoplasmatales archaeon]|nr:30S ribosomal protein S13 [Candidatus Thermoplasmatota archaeon]HDS58738.1 30S ribosomal protein S13 [Thermoplasmatales archaeon]